jgi:hypothetical protein
MHLGQPHSSISGCHVHFSHAAVTQAIAELCIAPLGVEITQQKRFLHAAHLRKPGNISRKAPIPGCSELYTTILVTQSVTFVNEHWHYQWYTAIGLFQAISARARSARQRAERHKRLTP